MTKLERILVNSKPVSFVREKAKKISIQGLCLYDLSHFFIKQLKKEDLNVRAAAIAFNFVMAIPAAGLFLCTLIPYLPISKDFYQQLIKFVTDLTPNRETQKFIVNFLDDFFNKQKTGLLSIGFLLALFYSSNAMMGIIRTFDSSIITKHRSNFIQKRIRALQLTVLLILFVMGTLLISIGQGELFKKVMEWMSIKNVHTRWWIQNLRWLVIIAMFLYSIAFIYKYAPSVQKRWKLLSPGAIFATFLTVLTTWLFSMWAQNFSNYNKFYGSIGTVLILMLLTFINSLILLIGFELNITITYLKLEAEKRIKKNRQA
ncbi:MAG: YihY/virulence factor BrkB family protein [Chitinophagaceae bacterium]